MSEDYAPYTGMILARRANAMGQETITAAVTLTADAWDKLTAGYKGHRRWRMDDPAAPDLTLDERIAEFLANETLVWDFDGPATIFDADLDDDVPF